MTQSPVIEHKNIGHAAKQDQCWIKVSVAVLALKILAKPVEVWQGNKRLETSLCVAQLFGAQLRPSSVRMVSPPTFSTTQCGAMDPRSVLGAVHCSEMWFCMGNKYLWRRREGQKVFNLQTQYSASVVAAFGPGGNMGGVGQWDV